MEFVNIQKQLMMSEVRSVVIPGRLMTEGRDVGGVREAGDVVFLDVAYMETFTVDDLWGVHL